MSDKQKEPIDAFHAHLDACPQCEKQPFNLCPRGAHLIKVAATQAEQDLLKWGLPR